MAYHTLEKRYAPGTSPFQTTEQKLTPDQAAKAPGALQSIGGQGQPGWQHPMLTYNNEKPPSWQGWQVTSMGSADPSFQDWAKQSPEIRFQYYNTDSPPPLNPILDKFSQFVGNPEFASALSKDPTLQASLHDIDNIIKSNAGIFREKQDGLVDFGTGIDGKSMYAAPELLQEKNNFSLGQTQLQAAGMLIDVMGGFKTPEEANKFASYTKMAGSKDFQENITQQIASGDQKGAVNALLAGLGKPAIEDLKDPKDKSGLATAFGSYNLVTDWDNMTAGQKSMAIAGLALNSFEYDTGEKLTDRVLITGRDPKDPTLTVGGAMGLAATGIDVMDVMRNWDQLDGLQRLTFGLGTAAQMATIGKQFGLLGDPKKGGAAVAGLTPEKLGALGFQAAPSAGVGAIIGPEANIPPGYTAVASGLQPNTVIAVPKGHEGTSATMNGSNNVTSLNTVEGATMAGMGALQVYQNWGKGGVDGAYTGLVGGTQMVEGLNQLSQTNPYMAGAIVALSTLGGVVGKGTASKVIAGATVGAAGYAAYQATASGAQAAAGAAEGTGAAAGGASSTLGGIAAGAGAAYQAYKISQSDMSDKDKGKAANEAAKSAVAAYYTFGLSALAQYADKKYAKGKVQKGAEEYMKYNTLGLSTVLDKFGDKVGEKVFSAIGGGTHNEEHMGRNQVRARLVDTGFFDEKYNVTLANGMKAYAGFDGKDGQHEFRDPSKVPQGNEVRALSAYDVDYTNDLDFSANIMTTSLMRVLGGGKGTAIDQVSGQLANAAISPVGYGQDMTQENFGVAQANVRSFFGQNGIKSKEDAYALANQMFAEKRITEMDLMQVHQGINMAFDENGFQTAQNLMAGRQKGIEVAHDMHPIGPQMFYGEGAGTQPNPKLPVNSQGSLQNGFEMAQAAQNAEAAGNAAGGFVMYGGPYWKPPTSGIYSEALLNQKDSWMGTTTKTQQMAYKRSDLSKAELKAQNQARYGLT